MKAEEMHRRNKEEPKEGVGAWGKITGIGLGELPQDSPLRFEGQKWDGQTAPREPPVV